MDQLGVAVHYGFSYDPGLLRIIERTGGASLFGIDIWRLYELYWLDMSGKPCVHTGVLSYDSRSKYILESKSVKLYLMSLNEHRFSSTQEAKETIARDIELLLKNKINLKIQTIADTKYGKEINGICIDGTLITEVRVYDKIQCDPNRDVHERLYSNVLKSNCPVTSQPDYGSLVIEYHGKKIDEASLLSYIISIRNQNKFHEDCIQEICEKLLTDCKPDYITVTGMYNRRGGIDINPIRSNHVDFYLDISRTIRQ